MICWAQLQLFKADEELERNNTSETLFGIGYYAVLYTAIKHFILRFVWEAWHQNWWISKSYFSSYSH